MAPSKKKKVVIPKPDMPALVPADCHIGKGDVEDGAEQGEGGAWENCESLDPELERLPAGHCVKEDKVLKSGPSITSNVACPPMCKPVKSGSCFGTEC